MRYFGWHNFVKADSESIIAELSFSECREDATHYENTPIHIENFSTKNWKFSG